MTYEISRKCVIEEREIRVYDDLLTMAQIAALKAAVDSSAFLHDEVARPDTADFKHWIVNIPMDVARSLPVFDHTIALAGSWYGAKKTTVYRCYCNYSSYGDMLFTHTDCLPGQDALTALWYIATEWDVEWGGETLFFDSKMDAAAVVSPRPGRLVIFDAAIPHVGRPPNRICYTPRYTLAFKLGPK